jgi:hypothetical protein
MKLCWICYYGKVSAASITVKKGHARTFSSELIYYYWKFQKLVQLLWDQIPRCQWYRRDQIPRCQWHRGIWFGHFCKRFQMREYKRIQRCHWHRRIKFGRFSNQFARRIRSHMRNSFSPWIMALGGLFDEK